MQGIEFIDRLNDVEALELQTKNYVEMLRIYCSRVSHHTPRILNYYEFMTLKQDKECIWDMRNESYLMSLERENKFLKWCIRAIIKQQKDNLPFWGI